MAGQMEERVIVARFEDGPAAQAAVERLMQADFPMDRISLMGRASGVGDDPFGIYYRTAGERAAGWGKLGAFWGGLWGLLAGAAGVFVLPGIGAVAAAGPIVEGLVVAATGAAAGGGTLAAAGALSHLAGALRHSGVPDARIDALHEAIAAGQYVVLLRCRGEECPLFRPALTGGSVEVEDFPFARRD